MDEIFNLHPHIPHMRIIRIFRIFRIRMASPSTNIPLIDVLAILNDINITLHLYQDDKNEEDKELCSEHPLAIIAIAVMICISIAIISSQQASI